MSQITDHIWLGSQKDATSKKFLLQNQIKHVVSFEVFPDTCSFDHFLGIIRHHISMYDSEKEALSVEYPNKIVTAIQLIKNCSKNKSNILLHCSAGKSRSPAVMVAYLMFKNNLTCDQAYDFVVQKRNVVSVLPAFLEIITKIQLT